MKKESIDRANILKLRKCIEMLSFRKMRTPRDFVYLSESISGRTHQYVSPTTLKRIWGYLKESTNTRKSTLNILSEFAGYDDWEDFSANYREVITGTKEGLVSGAKLDYKDIKPGSSIEISWMPDSYCRMLCTGEHQFEITDSKKCGLKKGDTLNCYLFLEGEALYFTDLVIKGAKYDVYKVGKIGGVSFKLTEG